MPTPNRTGPLRIGMIGVSGHHSRPLQVIANRSDAQLVAVATVHESESVDKLRKYPAFTPQTAHLPSGETLLEEFQLDAVIINPPYGMNARYATHAVARGIPVYCEKPYATELNELRELHQAVMAHKTPIVGMFEMRSSPVVSTAARLVREGRIGRPLLAFGQKTYKFKEPSRPRWYADRALYGGTIPWVAIHAIDWTRVITGLEFNAVSASHTRHAQGELKAVETAGAIHFECAQGGSAVITYDYLRPNSAETHGDDRFRIVGSEGELWGSITAGTLEMLRDPDGKRLVPLDSTNLLFSDLLDALRDESRPLPMSSEDGLASTAAALWARESADRQERLLIPNA